MYRLSLTPSALKHAAPERSHEQLTGRPRVKVSHAGYCILKAMHWSRSRGDIFILLCCLVFLFLKVTCAIRAAAYFTGVGLSLLQIKASRNPGGNKKKRE
jgi:hypothetical protein